MNDTAVTFGEEMSVSHESFLGFNHFYLQVENKTESKGVQTPSLLAVNAKRF